MRCAVRKGTEVADASSMRGTTAQLGLAVAEERHAHWARRHLVAYASHGYAFRASRIAMEPGRGQQQQQLHERWRGRTPHWVSHGPGGGGCGRSLAAHVVCMPLVRAIRSITGERGDQRGADEHIVLAG